MLAFLTSLSDHCNAYYNLFPTLASPPNSIRVQAFDQRGWGRSVQAKHEKGLTGPTSTVLDDINGFVNSISIQNLPLFIMGHSMGGAEVMHYMLSNDSRITSTRPQFSGVLLEAPFIALDPSAAPNFIVVAAGKLAAKLMPNRQMLQKLDARYMSRSEQVRNEWVDDPLCHDTGTLGGLDGMLQRAADLVSLSQGHYLPTITNKLPRNTSIWVGHGDGDKVVSLDATRRLYGVLECEGGEREIKVYPGAYHKLHAEPDGVGEEFAKDVGTWIMNRAAAAAKTSNTSHGNPKL